MHPLFQFRGRPGRRMLRLICGPAPKWTDATESSRTLSVAIRPGYSARPSIFSGAMHRGCATLCSKPHVPPKPSRMGRTLGGRIGASMRTSGDKECCGKNDLDRANRRERAEVRHLLGDVMKAKKDAKNERPSVL